MPAKLTADDVAQLAQRLDGLIAERGRVRVLFDFANFGGWENMEAVGAHMDQFRFVHDRIAHIDRIALVADPWQQQFFAWVAGAAHVQAKTFAKGQAQEAADWLLQ